ncbi:MAG: phosphopentomutase [Acetivibrionales bacterium]|jgi:phosphopentomutase
MKRAIILVMDSVGIGELPDADKYGDKGSNTLGHIAASIEGFRLPNLEKLGLGNIDGIEAFEKQSNPEGNYGRMAEKSAGKDTTTGHWEISGIIMDKPFPLYPNGFPKELIEEFESRINTKTLGNIAASGTEIIKRLGQQHVMTGYPIVYTSADSVFQVAAHEEVIPIHRLYEICQIARDLLKGEHAVGRVIARPFTGKEGQYIRTERRKDFSLKPIKETILDYLTKYGFMVKAVGKIEDIFGFRGITESVHTHNNSEGVDQTIEYIKEDFKGLIFTNLVDFDSLYGHRNDVEGYASALKELDQRLPDIMEVLKPEDILFITADHGCDPTTESTDHTREYVPLLVKGKKLKTGVNLGTRSTFADIAATIAEYFDISAEIEGKSFLSDLII